MKSVNTLLKQVFTDFTYELLCFIFKAWISYFVYPFYLAGSGVKFLRNVELYLRQITILLF